MKLFSNSKGNRSKPHLTFDFRHLTWKFRLLSFLMAAMLLGSCSAEKRLHRLVALHPELVTKDTIRIQDTTLIPEVRIDTLVHYSQLKDTVTIEKEKLTVRIHQVRDTVYIEAVQKPDTIVHLREIPVEKIIHENPYAKEKQPKTGWVQALALILTCGIVYLLIKLDKKEL
ncbi:MAG: hypothetical protein KBB11_11665 [Bacteroidales bacterium]|nr:hypothetical protein [Bacteroidales bacterium]